MARNVARSLFSKKGLHPYGFCCLVLLTQRRRKGICKTIRCDQTFPVERYLARKAAGACLVTNMWYHILRDGLRCFVNFLYPFHIFAHTFCASCAACAHPFCISFRTPSPTSFRAPCRAFFVHLVAHLFAHPYPCTTSSLCLFPVCLPSLFTHRSAHPVDFAHPLRTLGTCFCTLTFFHISFAHDIYADDSVFVLGC